MDRVMFLQVIPFSLTYFCPNKVPHRSPLLIDFGHAMLCNITKLNYQALSRWQHYPNAKCCAG